MALDILGPASAVNATTSRPAETRLFGATDTFFKPCSSPSALDGTQLQSVFLNGLLQQLRRAIRGMGVTEDNADDDMLLKAILASGAGALLFADAAVNMPIHAMVSTAGLISTTSGTGSQVVNTGQSIVHRGIRSYNLSSLSLANRTFTTAINKTYHLRWHAPGTGEAVPASSWPVGRILLKDLADSGYNPSALAETNAAFDSIYDNVLLQRIVTDGANALTVTNLLNMPLMRGVFTRASTKPAPSFTANHIYNWGRSPLIALREIAAPGGGRDTDPTISVNSIDRYSAVIYAWAWSDELSAGTQTAPSYGYTYSIEA